MSEKLFLLTLETQWKQMGLWDRLKVFRIPEVIFFIIAGAICQLILTSISFEDMVIPEVIVSDGSSTTIAMNPTFAYPLKLGGNLCFPEELSKCIEDPTLDKVCCNKLYDENSWPEETVTVLDEFLIIFFAVLTFAIIRLQLWRVNAQRSGFEYCQKYWALIFWDTLFGAFLAFEYSFFLTNFLKVSVSSPRPFYYAAKIYGSVHSDHRAPLRGDATKSFPSGHAATCMSSLGYLTLLTLEDAYHLSKTFSWSSHTTVFMLQYSLVPLFIAVWISASRIHDNWHFAADVLAAVIIGLLCALFSLLHLSPFSRSLRSVTRDSFRLERDRLYPANQDSEECLLAAPSNSKSFFHRTDKLLV